MGRTRDQLASLTPEDLARLADPAAWGDLERRLSPVAEAMAWLATGHCPPDGLPREQAADFEELDREFVALGLPEVFPAARGLLGRRPPFAGETPTPTPAPAPAGEPSPSWIGLFRDRLYAAAVETQRLQDSLDRAVESDPVARADDPPGRSPGEERLLARVRGMAVFRAGGRPPIYESLQVIWNLGGPTRSEWVRDGAAGILATRGMLWALGQILRHEPEAAAEALETCLATDFAFRPWLRSTLAFQPPDALLGGPPPNWVGRLARGFLYHETARIPAFPDAGISAGRRSAAMLDWEEGLEAATPNGSFGARLVARAFAAWCQGALVRGDPPGRLAEVYASRVAPRLRDDRLVPPMALSWIPEAVAQGRGAATRLGPLARAILSTSPGGLPDTLLTLLGTLATPGEPE